jgi:hypothetical protein
LKFFLTPLLEPIPFPDNFEIEKGGKAVKELGERLR